MSFEVNSGTAASALDGTEKIAVSQGGLPRVVTSSKFIYRNAADVMFTDRAVNIDNGTGGLLIMGDSGLTLNVVDGVEANITTPSGTSFVIQADSGTILRSSGSGASFLSWSSSGLVGNFENSAGLRIWDTDASHTLRFALSDNLTANRTITITMGNQSQSLDLATMNGAWTAYTPTVTAASGSFTSVSAAGAYRQIGKTIQVRCTITITTNGTAATFVKASLPVAGKAVSQPLAGARDDVKALSGLIPAGDPSKVYLALYDGTYPGADGQVLHFAGSYEAA